MPKLRKTRVYWRERGGVARAYGDFRDFADVGGKQEPLIAPGEKRATDNEKVALELAGKRIKELTAARENRTLLGRKQQTTLATFASHHLVQKKKARRTTDDELGRIEKRLTNAVEFFAHRHGVEDASLQAITVDDVQQWLDHLFETLPSRGSAGVSGSTVKHYLNALSNLYRRAAAEQIVPPGFNPAAAIMEKPQGRNEEAAWLEIHEASLLLEASRLYRPKQPNAIQCSYPLIATFLLTGGRDAEVLGLEVADISFDRKTVTLRTNEWRRLKTRTSARVVPPSLPRLSETVMME